MEGFRDGTQDAGIVQRDVYLRITGDSDIYFFSELECRQGQ